MSQRLYCSLSSDSFGQCIEFLGINKLSGLVHFGVPRTQTVYVLPEARLQVLSAACIIAPIIALNDVNKVSHASQSPLD